MVWKSNNGLPSEVVVLQRIPGERLDRQPEHPVRIISNMWPERGDDAVDPVNALHVGERQPGRELG